MTSSMHPGQRYDEARSRWHAPPPVEKGRAAHIHAPTATSLMVERTADRPDKTP